MYEEHPNFPKDTGQPCSERLASVSPIDAASLETLLKSVARLGMVVIEVGSWLGLSTQTIVESIRPYEGVAFCVDHWLGSISDPGELAYAKKFDVFQVFKYNMLQRGLWQHVRIMMMSSMDAAGLCADGIADLVFIDADHEYEAVRNDITGWLPKVKRGGIICGHDYDKGHSGVMRAVVELLKDFQVMPSCIWYKVRDI